MISLNQRAAETPLVNGAEPFLPFALPWIGEEEIEGVLDCLRSGWITTGPRVKQFEAAFAEYVGVSHAVAVNSCTAALHLALEALGVGRGDEVLVPTLTFAATAAVVCYTGARPVLIDCDPETLNIDVAAVEAYLEERCRPSVEGPRNRETGARVRAVVPVHFAGLPCAMERLIEVAARHGIAVVEDAAHALPARVGGRQAGTFGTIGCYSFYAIKNLTTGEGGMLVTEDPDIADRARIMSLHGISRDAWKRYQEAGSWYYEILAPGFKYNMTDLAAALGLPQLSRLGEFWQRRDDYARRYTEAFLGVPELETPPAAPAPDQHAWHLYVLRLNLERLRIGRGQFLDEMRARGIGTSVHFIPIHLHPYYQEAFGYRPSDLPHAAAAYERLLSIPLYPRMTPADVERVIAAVLGIVEAHRR